MNNNILLFGAGEIGRYLKLYENVTYENYRNINDIDLDAYSTVINCTFDKKYFDVNYALRDMFDWHLLDLIKNKPAVKLISLSSRLVFDRSEILIDESTPFDTYPINEYAKKKIILENEISNLLNTVVVRLPNVISAQTPPNRFFGQMLNNFELYNSIHFDFSIDEHRDFVFAGDVARFLHWLALESFVGKINYSYSDKVTVREFIQYFQSVFGKCDVDFQAKASGVEFMFDNSLVSELYPSVKFENSKKAIKKVYSEWIK
jgi:nucleoside-diphosphate-sugar epimerase